MLPQELGKGSTHTYQGSRAHGGRARSGVRIGWPHLLCVVEKAAPGFQKAPESTLQRLRLGPACHTCGRGTVRSRLNVMCVLSGVLSSPTVWLVRMRLASWRARDVGLFETATGPGLWATRPCRMPRQRFGGPTRFGRTRNWAPALPRKDALLATHCSRTEFPGRSQGFRVKSTTRSTSTHFKAYRRRYKKPNQPILL